MKTDLSPLEAARQREARLSVGLQDLAARHGHKIPAPRIDANGEFPFVTAEPYGEELAAILNRIPVRHGLTATQGHVLPSGTWCRINHFEAGRLLAGLA